MKPEIPAKSADEVDAFGNWRKFLCYLGRPGVIKKIKRAYNKRVRQYTKVEIAAEFNEHLEYSHLDDMSEIVRKIREANNG